MDTTEQFQNLLVDNAIVLEEKLSGRKFPENLKAKIRKKLLERFNDIAAHRNKDVVFFLGEAGSGKSTLINFLLGHQLEEVPRESLLTINRHRLQVVLPSKDHQPVVPIGQELDAETSLVNLYQDPQNPKLFYSDCGSFDQFNGNEIADILNFSNLIATRLAMQMANSVRVVWTIPRPKIIESTWPVSHDETFHFRKLFKDFLDFVPDNFTMVLTHYKRLHTDDCTVQECKDYLTKYHESLIEDYDSDTQFDIDNNLSHYKAFLVEIAAKSSHWAIADYDKPELREKIKQEILASKAIDKTNLYSISNDSKELFCLFKQIKPQDDVNDKSHTLRH